jgi:NAD(P)H-quinone oxidoreductase subunit 5
MNQGLAILTVSGPLLLLLSGIMPNAWCDRNPAWTIRLVTGAAHAALLTSLLAVGGFLHWGRVDQALPGLEIYLDALSGIMLLLVAGIGTVVIRYSRRYLDGDPGQGHFFKWLALTIGSVLILVISGNLIQFTLAWMATSLSLHRLLLFYPERPGARWAAHKKFVISRLGDLCLVAAMFLIYRTFGSLHFGEIFADAELHARHAPEGLSPWPGTGLFWIGLLLVFGAALKSAQFPFHSWLPEVMETPTPVSALMHAGIINAGGFLIVRMSPVMVLSPTALNVLAVIGAVTALFGALVMLTQNSIKKSLAFSTVGQMGFMMLQCGLGAFSSAMLHIVAHGIYKAHAFLSSGSIIDLAKAAWAPTPRISRHRGELPLAFAAALAVTWLTATLFGITLAEEPALVLLGAILQIALCYLIWNSLSAQSGLLQILRSLGLAVLISLIYFSLQLLFAHLLQGAVAEFAPERGWFSWVLLIAVLGGFMGVLLMQVRFPGDTAGSIWQAAYVHVLNGFYVSTLANRLLQRLWPAPQHPQSH